MSTRQKRPRGTVKEKPALNVKIDADAKHRIDLVADALGISQGEALEQIISHADIDTHGRPSWHDGPLATENEEELPLTEHAQKAS